MSVFPAPWHGSLPMHVDDQDQGSEVYTELENSSTGANNSQNNVDKEPSYTPVLISFLQYCR